MPGPLRNLPPPPPADAAEPAPLVVRPSEAVSFSCPFDCGRGPWQDRGRCVNHVLKNHLVNLADWEPLTQWAESVYRWICHRCHLLNPRGRPCSGCAARQFGKPVRPLEGPCPVGREDVLDPSTWHSILENSQPVIRSVPPAARPAWFKGLSQEVGNMVQEATKESVTRFGAFCRIMLAPFPRGGKKHSRQGAAVLLGRLARWEGGQAASLAREYLELSLSRKPARPQSPNQDDLLPEGTRRAALRAVRDGALSKAVRILCEVQQPLPDNVRECLERLHPRKSGAQLPDG